MIISTPLIVHLGAFADSSIGGSHANPLSNNCLCLSFIHERSVAMLLSRRSEVNGCFQKDFKNIKVLSPIGAGYVAV